MNFDGVRAVVIPEGNVIKIAVNGALVWSGGVPLDYKIVRCLKSTGTQYIDTGFTPDINSAMFCRMAVTDDGTYANWSGCVLSGNAGWFAVGGYGKSIGLVAFLASNVRQGCAIEYDNQYHDYYISNGLQKIDTNGAYNTIEKFGANMLTVWLFHAHKNYTGTTSGMQKIMSCQLYDRGMLVHDFIPCVRISDQKPGMYDVVAREFFTNAGTGEFEWE